MAALLNTKILTQALNEFATEFVAIKMVKQDCSDLATPDVFVNYAIADQFDITRGPKAKSVVTTGGFHRHYNDAREDKLIVEPVQRDLYTIELASDTIAALSISDFALVIVGLSNLDIEGDGKFDYFVVGPCFVEKMTNPKFPGNKNKLTLYPQPCSAAYGGITSGDATALAALTNPPPSVLATGDGAFGSYAFGGFFRK